MDFPDDVPTLTDGDVTLRAHRPSDADAIVEQCTDPVSVEFTTVPLDYTREMAVDWVTTAIPKAWSTGEERLFAIESTHPDGRRRFSGSLSLRDEGQGRAELAFGAHPAVRRRGVVTTAVNLLLDHGFDDVGLETVIWLANVGNFASRRVAWKTGFSFGGVLPRWLPQRGVYRDAWVGTLHRGDPREPRGEWYDLATIEGDRIRLRMMQDKDVPRIVEACSDERSRHWLAQLPHPYTDDDARGFILRGYASAAEGAAANWAVADRDTDLLLGCVGLPRTDLGSKEVGYWAHPDARGRGLMTEAVGLLVRHAFVDRDDGGLGVRRLCIKSARENTASQHIARANGFVECGIERGVERLGDGTFSDVVVFDLLPDEWLARGAAGQAS